MIKRKASRGGWLFGWGMIFWGEGVWWDWSSGLWLQYGSVRVSTGQYGLVRVSTMVTCTIIYYSKKRTSRFCDHLYDHSTGQYGSVRVSTTVTCTMIYYSKKQTSLFCDHLFFRDGRGPDEKLCQKIHSSQNLRHKPETWHVCRSLV